MTKWPNQQIAGTYFLEFYFICCGIFGLVNDIYLTFESDLAVKQKHDEPKKVEKDPEVKETIEDDKFTQKLQQEREKRRQS